MGGKQLPNKPHLCPISRRDFLKTTVASGALSVGGTAARIHVRAQTTKPNLLLIICDQMNLDTMSYLGNNNVSTPNLDRLAQRGVTFLESHSTNPVCSPARSALMTGRMPVETGVVHNDLPIRRGIPNLGEWFREKGGYETVYCGKWHLPHGYPPANLAGFRVLPVGGGQGAVDDAWVSRSCAAFLRNRRSREPLLMVASFMQPHDICYWMLEPDTLVPADLPFATLAGRLPALPPNHRSRPSGPPQVGTGYTGFDSDLRWQYYLYCYYRMVEMLDYDVGRLLDELDGTDLADNTIVVFTADHGEGAARHGNVQKWHPYDESMKVPLLCAGTDHIESGLVDKSHLVSGMDVMSTFCDFAGIPTPPGVHGLSLRPLLQGRQTEWREYLVAEWKRQGRIVRTARYKLVTYKGESAVQLFDMVSDPWEMVNLAEGGQNAEIVEAHRKLLDEWNSRMDVAPESD
ncbi:MAG: sulfatase-like hydrolase/transferase [Candidatus Zipacnadales bacterium]